MGEGSIGLYHKKSFGLGPWSAFFANLAHGSRTKVLLPKCQKFMKGPVLSSVGMQGRPKGQFVCSWQMVELNEVNALHCGAGSSINGMPLGLRSEDHKLTRGRLLTLDIH